MFTPEEYANLFMKMYEANYVEGLFLTSAIFRSADYTTELLLETVRLLRNKHHFRGYIHFKCLPGTSISLIKEAAQYADRMSVNIELPNKSYLSEVAEQKDYDNDIIKRQIWISGIMKRKTEQKSKIIAESAPTPCQPKLFSQKPDLNKNSPSNFVPGPIGVNVDNINHAIASAKAISKNVISFKTAYEVLNQNLEVELVSNPELGPNSPGNSACGYGINANRSLNDNGNSSYAFDKIKLDAGQTTQFVLGAAGEPDKDVLTRLFWEYSNVNLHRGYFSAFSPIPGTSLENIPETPLSREHRLYQADWLFRVYKIPSIEILSIIDDSGNLPMGDPKLFLAREFINRPIDVNKASYQELLRVPGVGPIAAIRIINLQKAHIKITDRKQLQNIGVVLKRADPWLIIGNSNQTILEKYISNAEKTAKDCKNKYQRAYL